MAPAPASGLSDRLRRLDPVGAVQSFLSAPVRLQTYRNLLYLTLGIPLGVLHILFVTVAVPVSLALSVVVVGIPLLALSVVIGLGLASVERRLAVGFLDAEIPARTTLAGETVRERATSLATDRSTWTALLYLPTKALVVLVAAVVALTTFSTGVAMLFVPLSYRQAGLYVGLPTGRPVELHPALHFGWNNLLVGFETVVSVGVWKITTVQDAMVVAAVGGLVCLVGVAFTNALARLSGWYTAAMLRETFDPPSVFGRE